ncbi:NAD(P)-binding protein [Lophiostoma macrostomum CBS 122681]|uniref:NAD(P)-binding protein n=1 Tax=Lophiostoma macrostomum CBS 122681 TaxID=1314788 RepID=A0A6A6T231_9PLEO|nr:NAD(P)-binding protein [Lophiostoma macrostomum CBS 122681]
MDQSFAKRTIAITRSQGRFVQGGASGIGLAIVRALALRGAQVYIADISSNPPEILTTLQNVHFVGNCDITSREACRKFIDAIPSRLDGLVNCAGICPAEDKIVSDELFAKIIAVNVTGSWNMGTEAIKRMASQETSLSEGLVPGSQRTLPAGYIVNITSGAAMRGIANLAAYCTSKHAVLGMTRAWAKDWPSLRINSVAPGTTDTPLAMGNTVTSGSKEAISKRVEQFSARIPLGRVAFDTDIADAVLFMLSDGASYVTGQVLPVNGGSD